MHALEDEVFDRIKEANPTSRLWHVDNGTAYQVPDRKKNVVKTKSGLFLKVWKLITFGFEPGSGDLTGWTPIVITQDMVGKTLAVFTSFEGKSENDTIKQDQIDWAKKVRKAGGIAKIFRWKGCRLIEEPVEDLRR